MEIIENLNTVVSVVSGIISIGMFFLAKNEKDKCIEIKTQIEQNIKVFNNNKNSSIKSKDEFNIENVDTFDNRKSIN